MSNSLEERLKTHSSAFDGLLSLIPAKYYYDDATSDQWQQKKKSKKEAKENKRAKFDPEAKEHADEYLNKNASAKDVMDNKAMTAKRVKLPTKKETKTNEPQNVSEGPSVDDEMDVEKKTDSDTDTDALANKIPTSVIFDDDGNEIEPQGTFPKAQALEKKKTLSPEEQKKREEKLSKLREKLSNKINLLKDKRKAPGSKNGGAVKSREQMLAERKRKEELKKERKKRSRAEMEEEQSDSDNEDYEESKEESNDKSDVLFGNIVFQDGSRVTSDLKKMRNSAEKKKQKGPAQNDLKAHLQKLEVKKRKLEGLSAEERAKQAEKDKWAKMMNAAEGIKVKDDEKLLKKALKRKERQKLKSEIEWKERKQVVKDTVAARAKRREENLKARKENKGKKSKKQQRLKKFTGTVNKKRAGFEGSAKTKKDRKK